MKKVISIILSLSIMLSLCGSFGLSVNAADAIPNITVNAVQKNHIVEVTLKLNNNPGVCVLKPVIAYDTTAFDVKMVTFEDGSLIPEYTLGANFENYLAAHTSCKDGKLSFVYVTNGATNTTQNGDLVTFYFYVKLSEPKDCTFEIKYPVDNTGEETDIAGNAAGGVVHFQPFDFTLSTAAHKHTLNENLLSGYVDPEGNANYTPGDTPVNKDATYTNGLYIQGAQVRAQLDKSDPELGLRFISVVNDDLIQHLKGLNGVTNVGFGTLLVSSQKIGKNEEITIDPNKVTDSYAKNIWRNKQTLGLNFEKYTACVIGIPEEHYATDIVIRPYITYTCETGMVHYIYGQQYSASLYEFALDVYDDPNVDDEDLKAYLDREILSKVKGDNDLGDLEF